MPAARLAASRRVANHAPRVLGPVSTHVLLSVFLI
jgi:hypothetical protein